MSKEHVIAYDFGTSGVKAVLVDSDINVVETEMAEYGMIIPKEGWAEQDPEDYWNAIVSSTHALLNKSSVKKDDIKAIVFATQAMGIIPLDGAGNVLHNNISWVDGRAEKQAEKINKILDTNKYGAKSVICKLLWIKEEMPELYENTRYFLDVNGYLRYRATGKITAELTGACSYGLDFSDNSWDKELFNKINLDINKLPEILISAEKVGCLTKEAADSLNLLIDTVVIAGCNDVEASAVGAISVEKGEGHIYLGSSAWICGSVYEHHNVRNGVTTSKSPDPSLNLLKGVTQSSGMSIDKAIAMLYHHEVKSPDIDEFDIIEKEVRAIRAGSDNLLITPWLYGETCPVTSGNLRSTVFNLGNMHTRGHIIKAIREGIGYNLRWTLENFENDYGLKFSGLNIVGGGGLSDDWIQCLSDILDMPLMTTENMRHAGAVGAAACALIGCGFINYYSDLRNVIRIDKKFMPRKENKEIYDKLFQEYKNLYFNLIDMYARLNGR